MNKDEALMLLRQYRAIIDAMQGHVFYCQDDEGTLRRWTPPLRPLSDRSTQHTGE